MNESSKNASEGLFGSLKNLTATLVAIVHTRLELLGTDLEEGRERLISLFAMTFVALFCLCFGATLLAILIVVALWDTQRILVLVMLTGTFLAVGGVLCALVLRTLKAMPRIFEASLTELSKDYQNIDPNH